MPRAKGSWKRNKCLTIIAERMAKEPLSFFSAAECVGMIDAAGFKDVPMARELASWIIRDERFTRKRNPNAAATYRIGYTQSYSLKESLFENDSEN